MAADRLLGEGIDTVDIHVEPLDVSGGYPATAAIQSAAQMQHNASE